MAYAKTAILLTALTALFVAIGYGLGGAWGGTAALAAAAIVNAYTWWCGCAAILAAHGAREIDAADDWDLLELVRERAARAGLPTPRVFLTDCPQPNAFAVGRSPEDAAVVLSESLRRRRRHYGRRPAAYP
jgi:heat shock protein HtpX